ncbi:MAG: phosphotransferase [Humibacter sp.]
MLPSGVSMLWESVSTADALRERFGFDGFEDARAWASNALGDRWGVSVLDIPRMVISDHNAILWASTDRGDLVVKWSRARELFPRLDASTRLLRLLAAKGVPVAEPVASRQREHRVVLGGPAGPLSVAVLPELTGEWLNTEDDEAVRAAGACLALLHQALASAGDMPVLAGRHVLDLRDRISHWLTEDDHGHAPEASRRLEEMLSKASDLQDEPQLVHNDFRAANILTRGSTISGVLDFDEAMVSHRVHDLAKASVYLSTRFTAWGPTTPAVRQALLHGYVSVRPLSRAEAQWLDILILWLGLQAIPGSHDPAGWTSAVLTSAC